jgi:hypothetical protein
MSARGCLGPCSEANVVPAILAERAFRWTGGGLGPAPPIVDRELPVKS